MADPAGEWSGYYLGGSLSFSTAQSKVEGNRYTYNQNQAVNLVEHDFEGAGLGGYAGWNTRRGNWVYGGEMGLGWDNLKSNLVFNADDDIDRVKIDWSGTLVGRLGYVSQRTLFYAKGGVAFAAIDSVGGDVNNGALTLSDAHIRNGVFFGPTLALGLERFVASKWIARAEYSYTDYGGYSQVNQDGAPGSQVYQIDNGPVQKISLGLAYKF